MNTLRDVIMTMADYHAGLIFLCLGITLVLLDYFAPTNIPAHFGYLCFGLSIFFALSAPLLMSALGALAAWIVFEVLHAIFLRRFLANIPPPSDSKSGSGSGSGSDPGSTPA